MSWASARTSRRKSGIAQRLRTISKVHDPRNFPPPTLPAMKEIRGVAAYLPPDQETLKRFGPVQAIRPARGFGLWMFRSCHLANELPEGSLWRTKLSPKLSPKLSIGKSFPVAGKFLGSGFWMGRRVGGVGRTL